MEPKDLKMGYLEPFSVQFMMILSYNSFQIELEFRSVGF